MFFSYRLSFAFFFVSWKQYGCQYKECWSWTWSLEEVSMLYETWPGLRDFVWSPSLPLTWCASELWHFSWIFSVFTCKMEINILSCLPCRALRKVCTAFGKVLTSAEITRFVRSVSPFNQGDDIKLVPNPEWPQLATTVVLSSGYTAGPWPPSTPSNQNFWGIVSGSWDRCAARLENYWPEDKEKIPLSWPQTVVFIVNDRIDSSHI